MPLGAGTAVCANQVQLLEKLSEVLRYCMRGGGAGYVQCPGVAN